MIGWSFLLSLLPQTQGVGQYSRTPVFRQWAPPRPNRVDQEHFFKVTRAVYELCLARVEAEPSLWPGLVGHLDRLPTNYREEAYALLERDGSGFTEDQRSAVWEAVEALARHHREYADADWALGVEDRVRLEEVAAGLEPKRASLSQRWLFDNSMPDVGIKQASSLVNYEEELTRMRAEAIRAIWEEGGLESLLDFAQHVKAPRLVGRSTGDTLDLSLQSVAGFLDADTKSVSEFAFGAVRAITMGDYDPLTQLTGQFEGRPEVQARILLMVNDLPEAWAAAAAAGSEVDAKYWAGFIPLGRGPDFPLVNETARKLVEHRRWATALDLMSYFIKTGNVDKVSTRLI